MTNEEEHMEKKLKSLFDFQKFDGNSELADMIAATEKRFSKNQQLSDEDLSWISAAGTGIVDPKKKDKDKK